MAITTSTAAAVANCHQEIHSICTWRPLPSLGHSSHWSTWWSLLPSFICQGSHRSTWSLSPPHVKVDHNTLPLRCSWNLLEEEVAISWWSSPVSSSPSQETGTHSPHPPVIRSVVVLQLYIPSSSSRLQISYFELDQNIWAIFLVLSWSEDLSTVARKNKFELFDFGQGMTSDLSLLWSGSGPVGTVLAEAKVTFLGGRR